MDIKKEPDDDILSSENNCQGDDNHAYNNINGSHSSASTSVKLEVLSEDDHQETKEEDFLIDSKSIKQENLEDEFVCTHRVVEVTYNASPLKVENLELGDSSNSKWTQNQEFFLEPINVKYKEEEEKFGSQNHGDRVISGGGPLKVEKFELGECSNIQRTPEKIPLLDLSTIKSAPIKTDVNKEDSNCQRVVVAVNLEKRLFFERNFVCCVCMQLFGSLTDLQTHKNDKICIDNGVSGVFYVCDVCNFKCECKSALKNHRQTHLADRQFKCDQCDFSSARKYQLDVHKCIHTGEKPLMCSLCDFKTAWQSAMRIHRLLHTGEKPFRCDQCDFTSAQKCHLKDHKWRHTSEKPFKCSDCGFSTAYQSVLKRHKLSHSGEKVLSCDRCTLTFGQMSVLKQHQLSHTGEKPFKCHQCSFTSAWKTALQNHQLLHTGEKPFGCEKCGFKSARQSALKRHILTHSSKRGLRREQLIKIKLNKTQ